MASRLLIEIDLIFFSILVFLNDNTIIEQIIRDESIIGVLGILECK